MRYLYSLLFTMSCLIAIGQPQPEGWAGQNGGTTGGFGGEVVTVTNRSEFVSAISDNEPRIVFIQDTVDLVLYERIKVRSNKTIIGKTVNAMLRYGGLEIEGDNVIVQNLIIGDFYDGDWAGVTHSTDCLTLYGRNIWIDHCFLFAGADGLLDVRSNSSTVADFITISYTRFANHNKVTLIGSSDGSLQDRDNLRVTFHHCWYDATFERGLNQRMPRVRFGDVHIYNNYYEEISSYCVAARIESDVVVESCYFRNTPDPHIIDDLGEGLEDPDLVAIDNIYELASGTKATNGTAFTPGDFYDYEVTPTYDVPALVMNDAGPFNPPGNEDPIAVNDTVDYSMLSGGVFIEVTENDIDEDGGDLRVAQILNQPRGVALVKANRIIYAPPSDRTGIDTITYHLIDTDGGNAIGHALIFFDGLTNTHDIVLDVDLDIFPNPASDKFFVNLPEENSSDMVDVRMFNINGQMVMQSGNVRVNQGRIEVDLVEGLSGLHLITIDAGNVIYTDKVIITE